MRRNYREGIGRWLAGVLVISMTLGQITGCQVTGGDQNGGTTSGYLTEENTDKADGSQTTTEEPTTEEEWKSIVSGEYYKQAKVSGYTNLYQLDMKVEEDNIYINKMFAFGDALGIQYCVGEDGYLALYDLADLRQKAVVSCPKDTYASDVFSNGTDEVVLYDKGNKELIRYGSLLDNESVMPIEKGTPDSYLMSKDLTGFFYTNAEDGQIYEYDLRSGEESEVCPAYSGEGKDTTLLGYAEEPEYLVVSAYDNTAERVEVRCYSVTGEDIKETGDYDIVQFEGSGDKYYASVYADGQVYQVYGETSGEEAGILFPDNTGDFQVGCDVEHGLAMYGSSSQSQETNTQKLQFRIYNVDTGKCESRLAVTFPFDETNYIYIDQGTYIDTYNFFVFSTSGLTPEVYIWDLNDARSISGDSRVYRYPWSYLDHPSDELKQELRQQAKDIGDQNGVEIHIFDEVSECSKDIYRYEASDNALLTAQSLEVLKNELKKYPDRMLKNLDDGYGSILKIYLAGAIIGTDETALTTAAGVQNTLENDTFLVIDINDQSSYISTIHHEIFHAIENHMNYTDCWFDEGIWSECNPDGFDYDYDYIANENSYDNTYVAFSSGDASEIAFIDTYSKSFPNEDRARVFEYAMTDQQNDNGFFSYERIRKKLKVISDQMSACFPEDDGATLMPWERVLMYEK